MSQTIPTNDSATRLDSAERIATVIADAQARSRAEKGLIWVASFDPGAQWGTGRCWFNTSVEPLTTDRIEGAAREGVYTPVGA